MTTTTTTTSLSARLADDLVRARATLKALTAVEDRLARAAGQFMGDDPAVASGIRRKPNTRADQSRHTAYDRHANAVLAVAGQRRHIANLEKRHTQAVHDETCPRDLATLRPGDRVRTRHGWHVVARVNRDSVSVETGHSWTDRVRNGQIIETNRSMP